MEINDTISSIEKNIFSFDVLNIPTLVTDLMSEVIEGELIDINEPSKLIRFNQIMKASLQAMQDRDYLLLADIIEYELRPMIFIPLKERLI